LALKKTICYNEKNPSNNFWFIADLRPKATVETVLHNINNIKEWMEGRLRKDILLHAFPKPYGASE
jgi:hypothetical protein